jgi:Domain of unknown function (DUF1844)
MSDEKKIIIDEDWKSQVQAEKEAAAHQPKPASAKPQAGGEPQMPPASLEMLVTTLVTEAMISLGQIAHPHTGETVFQPQQAKYLIDTIEVLREKTQGNVTPDETQMMEQLLHQLRLAYVQLTAASPGQADAPAS